MKKLLNITYWVGVFVIPLAILFFNTDKYIITATVSSIDYLQAFLNRMFEDAESSIEYKRMFAYGAILFASYKVGARFVNDRKLGLTLDRRKGDWFITIWQVSINATVWLTLYKCATFFKINTDAWVESFNIIAMFVALGLIAKLTHTYLWYKFNLGIK